MSILGVIFDIVFVGFFGYRMVYRLGFCGIWIVVGVVLVVGFIFVFFVVDFCLSFIMYVDVLVENEILVYYYLE